MANGIVTAGSAVVTTIAIDLVKTTLDDLERQSFTETFQHQRYAVCEGLFMSDRLPSDGGAVGRQKRIRISSTENAHGTRLFATGQLSIKDIMQTLNWPWVMHEAGMAYETEEVARNKGSAQIVDLVKTRRSGMWEDICNYFERRGMMTPDSSSDDLNPQGLLFHARMLADNAVDTVGGFNGMYAVYQDGTETTTVGGIDASTAKFSRLRNWAWTHDGFVDSTFLRQLRTAINRVNWRPPQMGRFQNPKTAAMNNYRIYWQQSFSEQYQELVNAGPDDRDGNASPYWGDLPYGPVDTVSTPVLDGVANSPVIGIDHSTTKVVVMRGRWMVEDEPLRDPSNHRIFNMWFDSSYLVCCDDPRRNFCGHTVR
jgi:hypothetical protein